MFPILVYEWVLGWGGTEHQNPVMLHATFHITVPRRTNLLIMVQEAVKKGVRRYIPLAPHISPQLLHYPHMVSATSSDMGAVTTERERSQEPDVLLPSHS